MKKLTVCWILLLACPAARDDDDSASAPGLAPDDDDSAWVDLGDDDSAGESPDGPPPLGLRALEISCTPGLGGAAAYTAVLRTTGWVAGSGSAGTGPALLGWDASTFDGLLGPTHPVDPWLPLTAWQPGEPGRPGRGIGPGGAYDTWSTEFPRLSDAAAAEAAGGTLLACTDEGGAALVVAHDWMVCARDFFEPDEPAHCWFCGDHQGEPAGTAAGELGTVGAFAADLDGDGIVDPATETWTATQAWTLDAPDLPCSRAVVPSGG